MRIFWIIVTLSLGSGPGKLLLLTAPANMQAAM